MKKVAIIGTGISANTVSYLLNEAGHEITVYEKNAYIGGHSRTLEVQGEIKGQSVTVPVDTGFIVFNYRNYPHMTKLYERLGVEVEKSDMSFGASIHNHWLEYGTRNLPAIFTQWRNIFRPKYWGMIRDVKRFFRDAPAYLEKSEEITLGEALDEMGMGDWFRRYFLLAMGGAIWSCPLDVMLKFPARTFIQFFHNHGLLTLNDQPQWYTVTGGSREYVKKLTASFADNIKLNCGAARVVRDSEGVVVHDTQGGEQRFDEVVFGCHADEALALLEKPTEKEREILGAFRYQSNEVILHSDTSFMPKRKGAWASWVYLCEGSKTDENPAISLSYWMNLLQNLDDCFPLVVTLNPGRRPDAEKIHNIHHFTHPIFTKEAIAAQGRIDEIQGTDKAYFCGAYQRYGFHEDGCQSGVKVALKMGAEIPWN